MMPSPCLSARRMTAIACVTTSILLGCSGEPKVRAVASAEGGSSGDAGSDSGGALAGQAGSGTTPASWSGGSGGSTTSAGGSGGSGGSTTSAGGSGTSGAGGSGANSAGTSSASSGGTSAAILNQAGNPITGIVTTYTAWLSTASTPAAKLAADELLADNMVTWQMPHGGWYKYGVTKYAAPWNGTEPRADWTGANGVELGTIDNDATVSEIMFLSDVFRRDSVAKYQDAARKGLDFLLTMQYPSGGFPQVYPARTGTSYSNHVTFNDNAAVRVLAMLDLARKQQTPFTATTVSADQQAKLPVAIAKGIDYILKAQILQEGIKTVWCAQHDPVTYAPKGARSYELPSKSGLESVGIIAFLMSQPQTTEIKAAAQAGIAWYKRPAVQVANTAYVSRPAGSTDDTYNPIQAKTGSTLWYRFYDLDKDIGFFSGRLPTDNPPGVGKQYNIMDIEAERRYGYQWGGAYGTKLFAYTDRVGY